MKIDLLTKAQLSVINKNDLRYPLAIAEKDYFLAVILQIIYNSTLKTKLIFKGGTAIHHLYLDQLRFSEDLDFTSTEILNIQDFEETFKTYNFLEILKYHLSEYALKIERLKFNGPLGQPNSVKIDIDLTQKMVLPAVEIAYKNNYKVSTLVQAMDIKEICAEKVRAINERARYRDFYDLTIAMKTYSISPEDIMPIIQQKELRKPLNKSSILENLHIAETAMQYGSENIYYREELDKKAIEETLAELINLF